MRIALVTRPINNLIDKSRELVGYVPFAYSIFYFICADTIGICKSIRLPNGKCQNAKLNYIYMRALLCQYLYLNQLAKFLLLRLVICMDDPMLMTIAVVLVPTTFTCRQ